MEINFMFGKQIVQFFEFLNKMCNPVETPSRYEYKAPGKSLSDWDGEPGGKSLDDWDGDIN